MAPSQMRHLYFLTVLFLLLFSFAFSQTVIDQRNQTIDERIVLESIARRWKIQIRDSPRSPCELSNEENPWFGCGCQNTWCKIEVLNVSGMNITGGIPLELFELRSLKILNLSHNILNGSIPREVANLKSLTHLILEANNLSGHIPPEIGNLTELQYLSLSANRFSGDLPRELGKLAVLEELYIDSNELTGTLPLEPNMTKLTTLWTFDNNFTGPLPEVIGNFVSLLDLRIFGTSFKGPIPSNFSALENLRILRLGELENGDSSLLFLRNITKLSFLSLRNCQIVGPIPVFFEHFTNLTFLDMSFNKLNDTVPVFLKNLTSLRHMFLGNNNLTGNFPLQIITENLTTLDVSFNNLLQVPASYSRPNFTMNPIGTSMDMKDTSESSDRTALNILYCLKVNSCTSNTFRSLDSSLSINCGGENLTSMGTTFDEDTELLGGAGFHVNSRRHWVVSNVASNNLNDTDIVNISNSNLNEPEPQIYLTARTSTSSLRYFVVDLKNGNYTVKLHFTDIEMDSSRPSWTGLRRRIFDIYIQNILEVSNFNILNEAKGSKPVIKEFNVSVTTGIVDVHLFWRGKGTCCIPVEGTYGPLLSAIQVFPVVTSEKPAPNHRRRNGIIVGIAAISAAGIIILSSVGYLWWKRIDLSRTHVDANMQ